MGTGLVICFSGRIGSGKTSITEALAKALAWPRAGFGDYLRTLVAEQGADPDSREALQNLGQTLVDSDPDGFCRSVLHSVSFRPGGDLVLDGIRHVDVLSRIRGLVAPSHTFLIHLAVDDASARQRTENRPGSILDMARAEAHRVEADLRTFLPAVADRTVDGTAPLSVVLSACLIAIEEFGADSKTLAAARARMSSAARGSEIPDRSDQ